MANDTQLVIKINGDIKGYQDALQSATKETEQLQNTLKNMAKTGAIAFAGFTAAIFLTSQASAEFDNQMRSVKTLLDESSFSTKTLTQGYNDLKVGALKALGQIPISSQGVTKSLFDIISATGEAGEALGVLASAGKLAVAGVTDVSIATDGLTSALNAYGLESGKSDEVAAKFFTAQKFGKTTISELSRFFGRAAATASAFGVSLDELLASTAAATTGGIKTEAAFTGLSAVLANISRPTADAVMEANRLGIEFNSTALRAKGLEQFLNDLTESENFNAESVEKLFSSIEAQKIAFALTGEQAEKFKEILIELGDTQKALDTINRAYTEQAKSLKNQTKLMTNGFTTLSITIGDKLEPLMLALTKVVVNLLDFINNNPGLTSFISKILIAGTVTSGLIVTVALAAVVFLKLRAAMIASAIATRGMSFAVKGLIGATGIGLLVAFLPEILELFTFVFEGSLAVVKRVGRSLLNLAKGYGNILKGLFTFDASALELGFGQLKDAFTDATFKAKEMHTNNIENAKAEQVEQRKLRSEVVVEQVKHSKKIVKIAVETSDKKIQKN